MIYKTIRTSTLRFLKGTIILLGFIIPGCKGPAYPPPIAYETSAQARPHSENYVIATLEDMQGNWVHTQDSLATVSVMGDMWFFEYAGMDLEETDRYRIEFTDTIKPTVVKKDDQSIFIVLKREGQELEYELMGLNDSIMSLMYYPRGNMHVYKRVR